jgi:hypothetical protein
MFIKAQEKPKDLEELKIYKKMVLNPRPKGRPEK